MQHWLVAAPYRSAVEGRVDHTQSINHVDFFFFLEFVSSDVKYPNVKNSQSFKLLTLYSLSKKKNKNKLLLASLLFYSERYRYLPCPSAQLKFFGLQKELLDDFRIRLTQVIACLSLRLSGHMVPEGLSLHRSSL